MISAVTDFSGTGIHIEKAILASILMEPDSLGVFLSDGVSDTDFSTPRHRVLFRTLCRMRKDETPIDLNSVVASLEEENLSDVVGGQVFLSDLMDLLPDRTNLASYAKILKSARAQGDLQDALARGLKLLNQPGGGPDKALTYLDVELSKIQHSLETAKRAKLVSAGEAIQRINKRLDDGWTHGGSSGGVVLGTGIEDLDLLIDGVLPGAFYVVAGRPGMGKTSLTMNIAENIALDPMVPYPVGIFSLEMSADELVFRMLCSRAGVPMSLVKKGELSEEEESRVKAASADLAAAPHAR